MTTIAVVGAGRGLGAAVARTFGGEGFDVALLARSQEHVDDLAAELRAEGIGAQGFRADARDPASLVAALDGASQRLGPVEVLQYSPIPQKEFLRPVLETTADDLVGAVEFSIYGPVAATRHVLPGMRTLGHGSILFVNGGSAVRPNAGVAGTSIAFAGEAAYARMLHDALAPEGIYVGQLIIPNAIEVGHPTHDPGVLATRLWDLHTRADRFRDFAEDMPGA